MIHIHHGCHVPHYPVQGLPASISAGRSHTVHCTAEGSTPAADITWWKDGKVRDLLSCMYFYYWPAHPDDPRGLEWPQVLNSLSVCRFVLPKFSNIISYDNII